MLNAIEIYIFSEIFQAEKVKKVGFFFENGPIISESRILNFCLKIFEASKSQKKKIEIFLNFGRLKKFWGKKFLLRGGRGST